MTGENRFVYVFDEDTNDILIRHGRNPISSYVDVHGSFVRIYQIDEEISGLVNGKNVYFSNKLIFPKSIEGVMR